MNVDPPDFPNIDLVSLEDNVLSFLAKEIGGQAFIQCGTKVCCTRAGRQFQFDGTKLIRRNNWCDFSIDFGDPAIDISKVITAVKSLQCSRTESPLSCTGCKHENPNSGRQY